MNINGVELEFVLSEENTQRRVTTALLSVAKDAERSGQEEDAADKIKIVSESIKNAFDYIFGTGTGTSVCGKENDLLKCANAFAQLITEKNRQDGLLKEAAAVLNKAMYSDL